ncbi:MAG: rane fusion protein heavy metal efflux system [Acidobacteriota bacterium]|jgi:RND family efflux transporter MFP subunit|nr:rane fusion protein heavy metal efflux system [Acidobacteriota bacterium]
MTEEKMKESPDVIDESKPETPEHAKELTVEQTVTDTPGARVETTSVESSHVVKTRRRRMNSTTVIAVALFAVAAVALLLWWLNRSGGPGRVVSAPRNVTFDQSNARGGASAAMSGEPTLNVSPDVAARAGIKVEPVGEQLAPEASQQAATGVVQPNAYRSTPVNALVGGRVVSVAAEAGQSVRQGQVLAVVSSDELASAQSRYLSAEAELEEHHKHHHRTAELVEIGAVSREEFEQSITMLKKAEAEVASLRQRLLLLGLTAQRVEALHAPAQISSEVTMPAPISGTVINRAVNPGEVVEANHEILRVADLSTVWVVGQVYEKDLARMRVGSGASVTTDAYPGRVFRGRVTYVDPQLDATTRTAQVRVELANPGQVLKLGMYVSVGFGATGTAEATAPTVPASAVQNVGGRTFVFLATADPSTYVMRAVRLGTEAGGRFPVLEGLFVGDHVVTEGSFMLRAEWLKLHPESGN